MYNEVRYVDSWSMETAISQLSPAIKRLRLSNIAVCHLQIGEKETRNESERSGMMIKDGRMKPVRQHLCCTMPVSRRASGVCKPGSTLKVGSPVFSQWMRTSPSRRALRGTISLSTPGKPCPSPWPKRGSTQAAAPRVYMLGS